VKKKTMNPEVRLLDRVKRSVHGLTEGSFGREMAHWLQPATQDEVERRRAYLLALVLVAVVFAAKHVSGLTNGNAQYTLYGAAIAVAALAGGIAPGLIAAIAAMLLAGADATATSPTIGLILFAAEALSLAAIVGVASSRRRQGTERLTTAIAANDTLAAQAKRARIARHAFDHFQQVAVDAAVFVINAQGLIVEWPESAARMYGYTAEQVLGSNASSILGGSGRPAAVDELLTTEGEGELVRRRSVHRRADGTAVHVDFAIKGCGFQDPGHFTIAVQDLSARRETEAFREAAVRAQTALQQAADETRGQLETLESLTDPAFSVIAGSATAEELFERLRSAVRADGIALVQIGRNVTRVVAAAGLRPVGVNAGAPAGNAPLDRRLALVHNDPARVAQVSAVVWPGTVSSLIVVPVCQAAPVAFRMEVVNEGRASASEWDLALTRVVADRLASAMLLRTRTDSTDAVA
jgi:PAS domain S-box-containing protein